MKATHAITTESDVRYETTRNDTRYENQIENDTHFLGETDTACNRHSVYSKLMMNRIGAEQQYNSYLFRNNLFSDRSTDEFVAEKTI